MHKLLRPKTKTFIDLSKIPKGLNISTITITCSLDTKFNIENIGRYINLSSDKIRSVKYAIKRGGVSIVRDYNNNNKFTEMKAKKSFFNQATIKIKSKYKLTGNPTNLKLFSNGSIQMTGCVNSNNCFEVLNILCTELLKVKAILDPIKMKSIIRKPFVTNPEMVSIKQIMNLKVRMINSNFNIGFNINRAEFYKLLLKEGFYCAYEPCVHACVSIKYHYNDITNVSIFVFESGAIIITGAKTQDQLIKTYNFITKILRDSYSDVVKINIYDICDEEYLKQLCI